MQCAAAHAICRHAQAKQGVLYLGCVKDCMPASCRAREERRAHRLENTIDTIQDLKFLLGIPHEVDPLQVGLQHGKWYLVKYAPTANHA